MLALANQWRSAGFQIALCWFGPSRALPR